MRLALRELRRRPGRFLTAAGALTLIVVLLLLLGGLLDGLYRGSTGALRVQEGDLIVYSADARSSLVRSRIPAGRRATVAAVDGVAAARGLGVALVGARVPGEDDVADAAVLGYEGGVDGVPDPPPPGRGFADSRLERAGAEPGDELAVGRSRIPVTVEGIVPSSSFLLQGGLWVDEATWREVLADSRPDAALARGTWQALVIAVEPGADPAAVASRIDAATGGAVEALTLDEAILALPGVEQQNSTFTGIIWTTLLVAALVVALFFALVTLERTALYGVLKAIGASSGQIVRGLFTQAVVTALVAFVAGALLAAGVAALAARAAPDIPLELLRGRALTTLAGIIGAALIGSAISLRRVIRIDPAAAIGGA